MTEQTGSRLDPEQTGQVVAGRPRAHASAKMFGQQHLIEREEASRRG